MIDTVTSLKGRAGTIMLKSRFMDHAVGIAKKIPGYQWINGIRHNILRIRDLSELIANKKIIVFGIRSESGNNSFIKTIYQNVVQEWLAQYGSIRMRKSTLANIGADKNARLLCAPQAFLKIPESHETYLKGIRHETRRLVRLAERQGYVFKEFTWNDHLDEIYAINISKEMRQSVPMNGWYRNPVQPRHHSCEELRCYKYYGAFHNGKLYAYYHLYICDNFAIGKHLIGHADHLRFGIMNGLISFAVQECIKESNVQWLYYGGWQRHGSLNAFKQHAGFQRYAIILELGDKGAMMKLSDKNLRTVWRL